MDMYWSIEQCRWVPCPAVERAADETVVPAQREAEEPELVAQS